MKQIITSPIEQGKLIPKIHHKDKKKEFFIDKEHTKPIMKDKMIKGILYLIGAGPGDPKLITLRGKECIQSADVLIYDYLANPIFLSWANPKAEIIYVGKKGGRDHIQQEEINELILHM